MFNNSERIGKMRHRVKILSYTTTKDAFGAEVKTWTLSGELFAHVEQRAAGSTEKIVADRVTSLTTTTVTFRKRAVTAADKIIWGTKVLGIVNVLEDEKGVFNILECKVEEPSNLTDFTRLYGINLGA